MAIRTYTGTAGTPLTAAALGATSIVTAGSATGTFYDQGGGDTGGRFTGSGGRFYVNDAISPSVTEIWYSFDLKSIAKPAAAVADVFVGLNAVQNARAYVKYGSDGTLRFQGDSGTNIGITTRDLSDGLKYHVWFHASIGDVYEMVVVNNDIGYSESFSGPGATSGVFAYRWEGSSRNVTADFIIDNTNFTTTAQPRPPVPSGITNVYAGRLLPNSMQVVVPTYGYATDVRVTATDVNTHVNYVSDSFPVNAYKATKVTIDGLNPMTQYSYQAQYKLDDGWHDGGGVGKAWTNQVPGFPIPTLKVALTGCEFDTYFHRQTWDDILAWIANDFGWWVQGGDWMYHNYLGLDVGPRVAAYLAQLARKPGMAQVARLIGLALYTASDHDRTNQAALPGQACIPYGIQAQRICIPTPDFQSFTSMEGSCFSIKVGRWLFIVTDDRSTGLQKGVAYDGGFADAQYWGAEQEDWIFAQMRRRDVGFRHVFIDSPIAGTPSDVVPKHDHMANYPSAQTRFGAVMQEMDTYCGYQAGMVHCFDYHALAYYAHGKHSNLPWACTVNSGSANDAGNLRAGDEHNYDALFMDESHYADGTLEAIWGKLTLNDDGTTMGVHWVGWDSLLHQQAITGMNYDYTFTPLIEDGDESGRTMVMRGGEWVAAPVQKRSSGIWTPTLVTASADGSWE